MKQPVTGKASFPIQLSVDWADFVQTNTAQGRYPDANAVLEAALCLLQIHEEQVQQATEALLVGADLRDTLPFDIAAFLAAEDRVRPYHRAA